MDFEEVNKLLLQADYLNARSVLGKHTELGQLVASGPASSPHLIAISETRLSDDVPDGYLVLPGYSTLFRADRCRLGTSAAGTQQTPARRGGGVLFLVRDDAQCWRRDDLQFWSESVWIEIKTTSLKSVVFGCFYRPPLSLLTDIDRFLEALDASLERISQRWTHIVGDFNTTSPQY